MGRWRVSFKVIIVIVYIFSGHVYGRDNVSCGIKLGLPLSNSYGPYDYTNPSHKDKLPIVLGAHFSTEVEMLIRGSTASKVYGDIDYTLRAIPNYHRALYAMSRLQIRDKVVHDRSWRYYSARCYFERAIYFNSRDEISFMLYGIHLHRVGNLVEAGNKYEVAEELGLASAEFYYNYGLLMVDKEDYKAAVIYSDKAYEMGYPLMGLKNKLKVLVDK